METFLREYRWAVNLGLITVAAFLIASIVNGVVGSRLAPMTVPKTPGWTAGNGATADTNRSQSAGQKKKWDDTLTERCLFGCAEESDDPKTCPDGCADDEVCKNGMCVPKEPETSQKQAGSPDVPVESDINVKLLGCMVADNADYSMALVQDGKSQQTFVVSVGDTMPGGAKVVRISRDRVFIRRNDQLEFIRLDKTIGGDPSPVSIRGRARGSGPSSANTANGGDSAGPTGQPPKSRNLGSALRDLREARKQKEAGQDGAGNGDGTVRKVSENEYVLDSEKAEEKIDDPEKMAVQGRVARSYDKEGKMGIKMMSVSPNSLYKDMGLETGDVIKRINGREVRNKSDISELVESVRERSGSVTLTVERGGETSEREYRIE